MLEQVLSGMLEQEFLQDAQELTLANEIPVLHQAAMKEDEGLLIDRLLEEIVHSNLVSKIRAKSKDGLTVLQSAVKVDNVVTIERIANRLTEQQLMECISDQSEEGETALHIAASENNTAALHALLKAVKQNEHRGDLLKVLNGAGEEVIEVARRREYLRVVELVEYHNQILSQKFGEFFKSLRHSLFAIDLDGRLEVLYKRLEECSSSEKRFTTKALYDASVCLRYGDLDKAKVLVDQCCTEDKNNIHTWCNKGVYIMKRDPSQIGEIERTAFRILDLVSGPSEKPRLKAKIDYAYWLAEASRREPDVIEGCQILKECFDEEPDPETGELCRYYYAKLLVRYVRSDHRHAKSPQWISHKLSEAVDQLILLYKSKDEEYHGYMWMWLAELQSTNLPKTTLNESLLKFSQETGIETVNHESCLNKAIEVENAGKIKKDVKFKTRIAKLCLDCGFGYDRQSSSCTEAEHRKHWFEGSLKLSAEWTRDNYWNFTCASNSAQALMQLWAIEFYEQHKDLVEDKYRSGNGKNIEHVEMHEVWNYITAEFYIDGLAENTCTRKRLNLAISHLERLVNQPEGWTTHGVKYARIKHLLGHPDEEVEQAFQRSMEQGDKPVRVAKVHEHFGYYFLSKQKYDLAKDHFQTALSKSDETKYKSQMARRGLKYIASIEAAAAAAARPKSSHDNTSYF